jgi:disulfide bond formation protein DsbB
LHTTVSTDPNAPVQAGEAQEFSRGYYLFFGAVAGFFVVVAVALTVTIGVSIITEGGDDGATVAVDTTSPDDGNGEGAAGDPVAGEEIFATCAACHGAAGEGVPGLGPSFVGNEFVASLSDDELAVFIEQGRPTDDPDNTTGIAMPPNGGNPSLNDGDLADVVAFLRTLE